MTTEEQIFINKVKSGEFKFSYSSLNRLLFCPKLFYKDYILKEREDKTDKHLIEGKLLHLLLLQPEMLHEQFSIVPNKIPSDNVRRVLNQVKETAHLNVVPDLEDHEPEIITALQHQNLYQSIKDDSKRLAKILTDDNKEYFKFLLESKGKDIVDNDMIAKAEERVELIKDNEKVQKLLQDEPTDFEMDDIEVYNEIPLECNLDNYDFGLKGIIDRYVVDHKNKIIKIIDFKTTGKTITEFPETVQFYNYWLQAAVYMTLVTKNLSEKEADYQIIFNFIVIDKYNQIYSFPVRTSTMSEWGDAMTGVFETATYHVNENNYSLPQQFLIDDMTL